MKIGKKIAIMIAGIALVSAGAVVGTRLYRRSRKPATVSGAVMRQNANPERESPIAGVEVAASQGETPLGTATSDFYGSFSLRLPRSLSRGDSVRLQFRNPDYQPLDEQQVVGEKLLVVRMIPLHGEVEAELNPTAASVSNVVIRYSTRTNTISSIGTDATTFEIKNIGNVPCRAERPCSPDGRWKAAVGSASLDAGEGNVFRNARASCIAGPCPFTRIDSDDFTRGGRVISIKVRDWSDTTTFLLEAEVLRTQIGDIVRNSYALIFGRGMNFTVPAGAEGTSIEAEVNGTEIVYPLGPVPRLSWADCDVEIQQNEARDYRCELKPGFRFQEEKH